MEWEQTRQKAVSLMMTDEKKKGPLWWKSEEKRNFELVLSRILKYPCLAVALMGAGAVWLSERNNPFIQLSRIHPSMGEIYLEKIRSMQIGSENEEESVAGGGSLAVVKNGCDKRVTKTGKWLRKLSIDELPQINNVIRGEMALVGPRAWTSTEEKNIIGPNLNEYPFKPLWNFYEQGLKWGWVGLAAVLARNEERMDRRWDLELIYAENASKTGDIRILKTMVTNGVLLQGK